MDIDPVYETEQRHRHCVMEIERLREALEIFAQHANDYEDRPDQINYAKDEYRVSITVTVGDLRRARSILVSSPADQGHERDVPDGWQLVPKEPTEKMKKAAFGPIMHGGRGGPISADLLRQEVGIATYRAMLAAAPNPTRI